MLKHIKNGDVIYDCGANIFDHSVFFALSFEKSKVIGFEPVKEYFEMGLKNIEYFKAKNIFPMNIALGAEKKSMPISIDNEGSSMVFDHKNATVELVEVDTIDNLVESGRIPTPNFVKIDVEGFALPLIKGAKRTFEKIQTHYCY